MTWAFFAPENFGKHLIGRCHAGARVDHEQANIGHLDRTLGQAPHSPLQAGVACLFQPGGVDHVETQVTQTRHAFAQIARDAGLIINQSQPLANQPVEKHGFSHVWPPNDGKGEGHASPPDVFSRRPLHY